MSTAEQTPPGGESDQPSIAAHELFVSYSHRDVAFAVRLRDALAEHGKRAWVDESGIRPSERWKDAITRAIEQAAAMIFVISPDSLASTECAKELKLASERGRRIISVLHRPVDMDAVPTEAADFQFIPPRGGFEDAFAHNVGVLVEAIDTDLDWLQQTSRWEQKALEWDRSERNESFLLSGQELELAESYLAGQSGQRPEPTALQNEFVLLSRRHQVAGLRRTRAWTSTALIIVSALAVLAFILRGVAVSNAHVATSRQYAAQGVAALGSDPAFSVLLSTRALGVDDTIQAESALRRAAPALPLLRTLAPGGTLTTAAYSPDGQRVVTASAGGQATVYDVASGRRIAVLAEPQAGGLGSQNFSLAGNGLTAASFSADGHLVLTASRDTTARVWNASTGRQLAVLPDNQVLSDAQFNHDASEIVTADDNGVAAIWQPGSSHPVRSLHEPGGAALASAVFSPDARHVLTAASDGTARIWSLATGKPLRVMTAPGGQPLNAASFSADGQRVVTASVDGTARVWDAATGALITTLGASSGANLQTAAFSPDGLEVVTAGSGPTVTVWDVATGEQLSLLHEPLGPRIVDATFSGDGRRVLTAATDGTARIWTAFPRQLTAALRSPDGSPVDALSFGPGGALAFGDAGGTTVIAVPGHAPVTLTPPGGATAPVDAVAYSSDGRELLTGAGPGVGAGAVRIWDATSGRLLRSASSSVVPVATVMWLPGDHGIVVAGTDGSVDVYRGAAAPLQCIAAGNVHVFGAALDPAGARLALGIAGGVRIVAVPGSSCGGGFSKLRTERTLNEPLGSAVGSVRFSADGRRLLTASNDGSARVWDLGSGRQLLVVRDPAGTRLYGAAFSPDARTLAIADGAGTATIFNARTGKQLTSVGYAQGARFTAVAYSPDGGELATAGFDGRASIWSAGLAAPLATVKRIALQRVDAALPSAELARYERQIH